MWQKDPTLGDSTLFRTLDRAKLIRSKMEAPEERDGLGMNLDGLALEGIQLEDCRITYFLMLRRSCIGNVSHHFSSEYLATYSPLAKHLGMFKGGFVQNPDPSGACGGLFDLVDFTFNATVKFKKFIK